MSKAKVTRQFIGARIGQLHLRKCDGRLSEKPDTTILCLHMMPKSGRIFAGILPELAADRLVIAPDYPGYGESDQYPTDIHPTIEGYADSIHELITHFDLEQVDLVGYHTGSMVSVALAHRYPDLIRKVINVSAPIFSEEEAAELDQFFAPIPLDIEGTRFRTIWERILHYAGSGMTLEMAAMSMAENLRAGERYEEGHHAAFQYASAYIQNISEIEQPVLVMNFGDDLFEHSKKADQYLNNGLRVDFPNWGHGSLDLWPREIAAEMLKFLDN